MPISTLQSLLANSKSRKVYLCHLTLGDRVRNWSLAAGYDNTFEAAFEAREAGFERSVVRVEENGFEYAAKSGTAEVDLAASAYYWDDAAGKIYISPAGPDPTAAETFVVVWFRIGLSNEARTGSGDPLILDGSQYAPLLIHVSPVSTRATDLFGSIGGSPSTCTLRVANGEGALDQKLYDWVWVGGEAEILFGGEDLPLSQYAKIFLGRVAGIECDDAAVTLSLETGERTFTRTLPPNSFTAAEFPSLDSADEGKPIPIVLGEVKKVTPVRISYELDYYLHLDGQTRYAYRPNADIIGLDFTGSFTIEAKVRPDDIGTSTALDLDGSTECAYGADKADGATANLTIEALIYLDAGWSAQGTVLARHEGTVGKRGFRFMVSSGRKLQLGMLLDTVTDTFQLDTETWYKVKVSFRDSDNAYRFTVDNVVKSNGTHTKDFGDANCPTKIGAWGDATTHNSHFKGKIDYIKFSNVYDSTTGDISSVTHEWNFDSQDLTDSVGSADLTGVNIDSGDYTAGAETGANVQVAGIWNGLGKFAWLLYIIGSTGKVRLYVSGDGTTYHWAQADTTSLTAGSDFVIRAGYASGASPSVFIAIDGLDQSLTTGGTCPSSLNASDANFCAGLNFKGRLYDLRIADGCHPGTDPLPQLVSSWEFSRDLVDSAGQNHLTGVSIDEDDYRLNYALRLDGSRFAFIKDGDQSGLDIAGPITIAARLQPSLLESHQPILSKWDTSGQRSYKLELLDDQIRLLLSSNGSSVYALATTAADLQVGHWYEIKATYDTSTNSGKIYLDGVEQSTSTDGTAPNSLNDSTAEVRIGAEHLEPNFLRAVIDWVAVAATYQADSGPITNTVSHWQFDKNLDDSVGANNLGGSGVTSGDYLLLSSKSVYKIADSSCQRLKALDGVRDGDTPLAPGDYEVDLQACELRTNVPISNRLEVDVRGATMGDLLGNDSTSLNTRAAYAARFLLQIVAGQRADRFDSQSFLDGSAAAPLELNLYLDKRRNLGYILKQICDSVFADIKVSSGLYSFSVLSPGAAEDCVEIRDEDIGRFSAAVEPRNVWHELAVRFAHDGSGGYSFLRNLVPEARYLFGRELARREFTTLLNREEDTASFLVVARMLARNRQFLVEAEVLMAKLINSDVGDKVRVTRKRGPGGPPQRASYEIVDIDKDYETGSCRVVLSSLRGLGEHVARFTPESHPGWGGSSDSQRTEGGYFTDNDGRADPNDPGSEGRNLFWR